MKVILYMAISADGFIAKLDHETPWTDDEFRSYSSHIKHAGNLIIGKTTWDFMLEDNPFDQLGNPLVVVLTSSTDNPPRDKVIFVKNFSQAIKALKDQGFSEIIVAGGSQVDRAALDSGLIDEIYLDIEPIAFGQGISLFAQSSKTAPVKLNLLGTKKIGDSGVQLHYQVVNIK